VVPTTRASSSLPSSRARCWAAATAASSSGPKGPFLKIAWTHLGLGSSGKGLFATTWASSARVRTTTLGRTPRCMAMARSSAAAILAVSASSLVKPTLPL
jgi:hypothetical protein